MAAKSPSHWPISITNGAAAVLNIFLPIALVRILTPDQIGRYKVFFLYVTLSPGLFFVSGLSNGLYHWAGKYPESKPEVQESWTLFLAVCLTGCLMGLILTPWVAPHIHVTPTDLRLFLIVTPLSLVSMFFEDLLIASGKIWAGSFYSAGFSVVRTGSILIAAWWTHSVETVIAFFLAGTALRVAAGWFLNSKGGDLHFLWSREKTRNVLRYALPVSMAGITGLALGNLDQTILSFRLSPAKFAFYAVGCLAIPPLQILDASVNRVLIPRLAQAFSTGKQSRAMELYGESVSELFRYLLPATIGLVVFSQPIIRILFTERYAAAAQFLRFYAFTYLFASIPFDAVARARADGKWILRTSILFSVLTLAGTWMAAGRWGAMGALIAILTSQFFMRLYSLQYGRRCFEASYANFLPLQEMLEQLGFAFAAAAVSYLLRPLFPDPRHWFWGAGLLFTLIYFGGTFVISLRRHAGSSEPIHVLELAQTLGLGGLERMVYSLAQALNQLDRFRVLVATYDQADGQLSLTAQFEEAGIPLIQWQKGEGFSFSTVVRLVHLIFEENTRIVHVHDLGPLVYGSFAKILSLGRVRLFVTLHTLMHIQQNRKDRLYYKIFLRFADRIIAVSPGVRTGLLELGLAARRIEVIPNGVTFAPSIARMEKPADGVALRERLCARFRGKDEWLSKQWILCMARLHSGKGQDVVLDVWNALPSAIRPTLVLFFVGQETEAGYAKILQDKIQSLPDRDNIVIVGPSERPQDWIQAADLFISGSLHEGMPLAPLEAVGFGLPTFLSDIEGHQFLRPWAHFFEIREPEKGASRMVGVLESMKTNDQFFEDRWAQTAPVRDQWGAPVMAASYAQIFQSASG